MYKKWHVAFWSVFMITIALFLMTSNHESNHDERESTFFTLEKSRQNAILACSIATSSLSILGSSFIIISYVMLLRRNKSDSESRTGLAGFHKSAQANPTEVVLILSVGFSDFFASLTKFFTSSLALHSIHWDRTDFQSDICEVLGFTEQFFTMSANIWVLFIAVYLYRLIVNKRDSLKYVTIFQLTAWGLSFVSATIPLFQNMFGSVGPWCWLMIPSAQWILFYVPVVFIFFSILIIYAMIFIHVRTHKVGTMSSRMKRRQKTAYFRLLFFPLAFLVTWMGGLIWRAEHVISDRHNYRWSFFLLTAISLPSQGWLNAIAWYWFNKSKINHMYYVMFLRCFYPSFSNDSKSDPLLIDVSEAEGVSLRSLR